MAKQYANDLSLILERGIDLAKKVLDVLENQADQFIGQDLIPKNWTMDFQALTKSLNDLSLAHARHLKADKEAMERMSPEEKLAATKNALLALHGERPALVEDFLIDLQDTFDGTHRRAKQLEIDRGF